MNFWNVLYWSRISGRVSFDDVVKYAYDVCATQPVVDGPLLDLVTHKSDEIDDICLISCFIDDIKCSLLEFVDYCLNCIIIDADVLSRDIQYKTDALLVDIIAFATSKYVDQNIHGVLHDVFDIIRQLNPYDNRYDCFENEIDDVVDSLSRELSRWCSEGDV
ncbi:hypothetical protein [Desulfovibrio psychrotolerans]|uniref:Uncharacterized protein n=1 Tax=Desulfovibrio psychrotolerans TaxID=415242 RepID=A0A7J0BXV7_9BACT|nr:hypothetical protein [Desulfovibrio psychrotolerans]GFM38025.1 hypothetical protein DSM19430T_27090 [Desulfovibrio psychrotolerans]